MLGKFSQHYRFHPVVARVLGQEKSRHPLHTSIFLNSSGACNKRFASSNKPLKAGRDYQERVWKIASCVSALSLAACYHINSQYDTDTDTDTDSDSSFRSCEELSPMPRRQPSAMLATSASVPNVDIQRHPLKLDEDAEPNDEVDFIIIGYGNAGKGAANVLLDKCANARIMIVDPHSIPNKEMKMTSSLSKSSFGRQRKAGILHVTGSAVGFNHSEQTIDVFTSSNNEEPGDGNRAKMKRFSYTHSVLICSGVRGAPPPESLIDEAVTERILELRPTQMPSLNQYILNQSLTGKKSELPNSHLFPILPRQSVRQIALMAASQGANICILGSDLEAVELAAAASRYNEGTKEGEKKTNKVCLLFGGAAPLGGMLPRYLSAAVSKRLRAHGIYVADRSLVRFISSTGDSSSNASGKVEVHMVKSYDTLDTKRYQADLIVGK